MKSNCNYDKVKLLQEVSNMIWRLEKHYIKDAKRDHHPLCKAMFQEMADDLKKYKQKLVDAVGGLAQEGKLK